MLSESCHVYFITKNGEKQKIALMEKLLQISTTSKVKLF
jgi:hypothetical protein